MAISAWIVRRVTYQAWMGAGWPQWVLADESIEEQDEESFSVGTDKLKLTAKRLESLMQR